MRFSPIVAAALLSVVGATPTQITRRASNCEQYGSVTTGSYTVYNNLFQKDKATSGSQCFSVNGLSNGVLSWVTNWSWAGGAGQVKSYANAVTSHKSAQVGALSSMNSRWSWKYTGSNLVADVAYDLFTSSSAGGNNEFEIMVWLAALGGAAPISANYDSNGNPKPIASPKVGNYNWNLYQGKNGGVTVYSYVSTGQIGGFSGDLLAFFKDLIANHQFSKTQYLRSAGAGTEAFTGSNAVFTTSAYSLSVA